ncbi:MAG TPA: hypothetical protein VIL99_02930 [Ignavibacteria bacterium]
MNIWNRLKGIIKKQNHNSAPLIIIQKDSNSIENKEYSSIEIAIADLEGDLNIPKDKLEQLRKSLNSLKNKSSIRIKNGEIVD